MKKFLWTIIILIVLGVGLRFVTQKTNLLNLITISTGTQDQTTLANPASVNCEEKGGTVEIVTDANGGQSGLCHLTDGTICDEWAYYRGECPVTVTEITGIVENLGTINETSNASSQTTSEYSVETEMGNNIPGENINVFDKNGNKIFSLLASNAPDLQHFDKIVGKNIIVDYGTSFDRTLAIFDVTTQEKIFESAYHDDGSGLGINNDGVTFNYTIGETPNLPKCSSDYNGHTEVRIFNLNTKELKKTGEIKCAFFE